MAAGGSYNPLSLPLDPGFYINFQSAAQSAIQGLGNGTVLVPFTADWGPVNEFVTITSQAEYDAIYSTSTGGTGRYAVLAALRGGGGARSGASEVLAYRMADAGAAKATLVLNNTSAAAMLTLTAKYEGVRPADWTLTVQTNTDDATTKDIILKEDGVEIERFTKLDQDDTAAMVAALNSASSGSDYFVASAGATGVALANVTNTPFATTAGDSGLDPVGSDFTAMMSSAENEFFQVMAPAELTDATIRTAMVAWAVARNATSKRFTLVTGGAAGETIDDAVSRALSFANPNVVAFGYTDVVDEDGVTVVSTAKFAPALAGMIADAGVTRSITNQRFAGRRLAVIPNDEDIRKARENGVLIFTTDSRGMKVQKDQTSYSDNTSTMPRSEFGNIKSVRTHQQIHRDLTDVAVDEWIGGDSINVDPIVKQILAAITAYLGVLEGQLIIQPGWFNGINEDVVNPPDDALFMRVSIATTKALERIFLDVMLG